MIPPSSPSRPHLFGVLAGLFLAVGLAVAASILARTWIHLKESQIVTTSGSARNNVKSDLIVWDSVLQAEQKTLPEAHAKFEHDFAIVSSFLREHGYPDYSVSPVRIQEIYRGPAKPESETDTSREIVGYRLQQNIQISSPKVDSLTHLAAESLLLTAQNIALQTHEIKFIFTKVEETRVQMAAAATSDARRRAEEIAKQGGRVIAHLRTARMGVVQVNPMYSTATTWEGNNDTSTLDKTITVTVNAEFTLK